jgi:uncharacterized protein RhaS with RHS repeats
VADPQTLNYYGYALNNPVGYNDPTGKDAGINNPVYSGYWNPPAEAIPGNPVIDIATGTAVLTPAIFFSGVTALISSTWGSISAAVSGAGALSAAQELSNSGASDEIPAETPIVPSANPGLTQEITGGAGVTNWNPPELLDELANSGVKYNPDDVTAITKAVNGKLVWLETGNEQSGLEHIMSHANDFAAKGISKDEIVDFIMNALSKGEIVGYQGEGTGRPIYEVMYNGVLQRVAITVGSNGYIVGANPR